MGSVSPEIHSPTLVEQRARLLPQLLQLAEQIEADPVAVLERAFPDADPAMHPPVLPSGGPEAEWSGSTRLQRLRGLEEGARAIRKFEEEGPDAPLEPEEEEGFEAIVRLVARPAILFRDGSFEPPPPPWGTLESVREALEANARRVGRIQLYGHPRFKYGGTGFVVGEEVVMTNRHVAELFCYLGPDGQWYPKPTIEARINFAENPDAGSFPEFALMEIVGVHGDQDLALFRVEQAADGAALPGPLPIASQAPGSLLGRQVTTVGYPAEDTRADWQHGLESIRARFRIFGNLFDVKRLQPGEVIQILEAQKEVRHDCSTLGGNSGSCLLDLEAQQVLGLHFAGRYRQYNRAVALWRLKEDPLLVRAGVNFV